MNRKHIWNRVESGMIVDLKAQKRLRPNNDNVLQPLEKTRTLLKIPPNYREGTYDDILKLLKTKSCLEDGVFLKGKIPCQDAIHVVEYLKNGGFSKSIHFYKDPKNPSLSYVCKKVIAEKFNKNEVIHLCKLEDVYICKLYGLVRTTDEYCIFMEYCGKSLQVLTQSISFPLEHIVEITRQLCMAVDFAHNKKILHLDIKPENVCVLITSEGILVKLTDWGSSITDNLSTEVQSITLSYASPELLYLYLCRTLPSVGLDEEMKKRAMLLTKRFCLNYNNIELISTKCDSFSIGLTIMFAKTGKHLYGEITQTYDLLQMFAENSDAAKNLLPTPGDFATDIARKLVEGISQKRDSVVEIQKMISEFEKNSSFRVEVTQDTSQPDTILEDQELNVPFFEKLF